MKLSYVFILVYGMGWVLWMGHKAIETHQVQQSVNNNIEAAQSAWPETYGGDHARY